MSLFSVRGYGWTFYPEPEECELVVFNRSADPPARLVLDYTEAETLRDALSEWLEQEAARITRESVS